MRRLAFSLLLLCLCLPMFGATAINDNLYLQNGQGWNGYIDISWPTFTTSAGRVIPKGARSVQITNGLVSISLEPNEGAVPSGVAYTARYRSAVASFTETWVLPVSPSIVTLSDVRKSSTLVIFVSQIDKNAGNEGDCLQKVNGVWATAHCVTDTAGMVSDFNGRGGSVVLAGSDVTGALGFSPEHQLAFTGMLRRVGDIVDCPTCGTGGGGGGTGAFADITGQPEDNTALAASLAGREPANANIQAHISNTSNPHSTTKAQVGLGNVANSLQLIAANNLSDLQNVTSARTNLGLGSAAIANIGNLTGNVAAGDHTHPGLYAPLAHTHTFGNISGLIGIDQMVSNPGACDGTKVILGDRTCGDAPGGGSGNGEINTASSGGTGGVGITLPKSGVNLPFKNIIAGSTRLSVTDDAVNKNVVLDVLQSAIDHTQLTNIGSNSHAQIDSHIASTSNPHSTTAAQVGAVASNTLTTLGDTAYYNGATWARIAGSTNASRRFFCQTGTGAVSAAPVWCQPSAADISGLAGSATTDTTNAANISSGNLPWGRVSALGGSSSSTFALGNHVHANMEVTTNKDQNGGYVGRDASGNIVIPGLVTSASYSSSDTTHTGGAELVCGTAANLVGTVAAGSQRLFCDSANGNKLSWRTSSGTTVAIEGSGGGGSMVYPGAGVPNSTGSAWGTSYTVGSAANNIPQLDGGGKLLAGVVPTLNQSTTGTAAGLAAQYIDWSAGSGGPSIANKPATNGANGLAGLDSNSRLALAQLPQDFTCVAATASGTAYGCNFPTVPASLVDGEYYALKADLDNTGAVTFAFNSFGAIAVTKVQGGVTTALAAGDIRAGMWVVVRYDGTRFQMTSQLGNAPGGSMTYPGAGVPNSTGSAWGTSYSIGGVNGLVQLNGSGYLPALNGSLLTNLPAATALSAQYIDWNQSSGPTSIANKPTIPADVSGAHYLTTQAEAGLSAEANLGALSTGLVKITVSGGVATPSTAAAGTDYVAPAGNVATATALAADPTDCSAGQFATTIAANGNLTCAAVTGSNLSLSDVTTNNASSSAHGFMPKLDNTATHFMDMTGSQRALAVSDLPAAAKTDTWSFNLGTDNASADLVAADIGPQGRIFMVPAACTVSEITVAANAGTPSVIVRKNHAGTQTDLVSGTLATGSAGAVACAATGAACADGTAKSGTVSVVTTSSTNVLAAGDWLETTSGVASSGAKRLSVAVTCVRN